MHHVDNKAKCNQTLTVPHTCATQKILKDATLFFSRSTPNLATVIPAMDLIDEVLTTNTVNHRYTPSIRSALSIAKRTLNRYYELTDGSEVYRIAMGKSNLLVKCILY